MAAKTLAAAEAVRLAECERIINEGVDTFITVGEALTEIRDSKLYRGSHKTFEAYCLERWDIGKSHAYRLIDHAKAVEAISEAAGVSSPVGDISERETRAIKADLPAVVEDIKFRVQMGETPQEAAAQAIDAKRREQERRLKKARAEAVDRAEKTAEAKRQREAERAEYERQRDGHRANLPAFVAEREQAKASAAEVRKAAAESVPDTEALEARVAELGEANAALEADLEAARKENAIYADMKVEWDKGGFEEVIAGLKFQIGVLGKQVETESGDKAYWKKKADYWREQAKKLGWQSREYIDLDEAVDG